MTLYRIGHWAHSNCIPVLPGLAKSVAFTFCSCILPSSAEIGEGTHLAYAGLGTVIHHRARIGKGCLIGPNVTIGGRSGHRAVPVLGDGVFVGCGARILGPVHVGAGSVIGANAVVIADVPERSVVAGVPAKVIRRDVDARQYATMPGTSADSSAPVRSPLGIDVPE